MYQIDAPTRRERKIIQYLRERQANDEGGASVREIYEHVTHELNEEVSRTMYYKVLNRLETTGQIEISSEDDERGRLYTLAANLNVENAVTLDDLYEQLETYSTTDALARVIDARDYFQEHQESVIKVAAEALLKEDPVNLFFDMIIHMIDLVQADVEIIRQQGIEQTTSGDEPQGLKRFQSSYSDLDRIAYRGLSLPREAIDIPLQHNMTLNEHDIEYDAGMLRAALDRRVFGSSFIYEIDINSHRRSESRQYLVVSGSDGSMHAGTLALQSAKGYYEDISDVITFNNSVAYIDLPPANRSHSGIDYMVYTIPFERDTIDDPNHRGMVLAPFMYAELGESEYEHMARAATDVVQFRVDEKVFTGEAQNRQNKYESIPKPQVHIRDGTITPQEREFGHYKRLDAYGEMVREGIRLERRILDRIIAGGSRSPIFAGSVKSTQMRIFSVLLNWYIAIGSRKNLGAAIEPNWNLSRAAGISDNVAMTSLLSSLDNRPKDSGKYYVTCALMRQFPSLTEFYRVDLRDESWLEFFEKRRARDVNEEARYGYSPSYHTTVDLADDDFIFMCERADFVMFYVGHTGGDPAPSLPRYEFLTSLRQDLHLLNNSSLANAKRHVLSTVEKLVDALDFTGWEIDRDHNFLSSKSIVKIVPHPIYRAHELSKTLGKKLDAELRSIVISRLIEIKKIRSESEIEVRPVSLKDYMTRLSEINQKDKRDKSAR